ncbi:helix-turn-helix transcriptional regulator [Lactobacillus hamsteri]|uniref:Transcriptional regulator n=1 Tax=Lactobacillus hamsteri DSM 5661 = JCM 6256 TaxID=1423754 RepID=A0A0R1YDG5_9LACO|nr:helix-turn-helix transcriptional regulator [Lactobacillus hamsteri]KRM40362.1 transcriptional regulator [Lactobacillus hamsteri DSM 5661 = JCM 6256]
MTIGEQLKKTRTLLGLTQTQMCSGIVTESFYSRVERGLSEINATDLFKILNEHHVSLYDFFEVFEDVRPLQQVIEHEAITAFNNHNLSALKRLDKNNKVTNHKLKLVIRLMISVLTNSVDKIPVDLQVEMKHNILQIGNWNEAALWELAISMSLYDFDEMKLLIDSAFSSFHQVNITDEYLLAISNVAINYLAICYKNKDLQECTKAIQFINKLPLNSTITMSKIIAKYYQALIDNDKERAEGIIKLLKQSGYSNYVKNFPQLSK